MILEAEKRGEIRPGGLVVESTAGNTGIGLALVANARGYRTLIVIPETQSQEKKDMLRLCGAELVEVPALPYSNPNNYQHVGRRPRRPIARKASPTACCSPTSGTTSTTARRITSRPARKSGSRPTARSTASSAPSAPAAPSPAPAPICTRRRRTSSSASPIRAARPCTTCSPRGEAKASPGGSITEGIGLGRVTAIIADIKVDKAYLIPDEEAVPIIFDLLEHEGLCMGGSTGINVAGAIRLAKELGPGHTIVTLLCDYGSRYQSKLFNPEFLRSKSLPVPEWLTRKSTIKPPFAKP